MTVVVSFVNYVPPARFDDLPWTVALIQEAPTSTGSWTQIDAHTLDPVDSDPATPETRSFTTTLGTAADQWYRIIWRDAALTTSIPTEPFQNILPPDPYATTDDLFRVLLKNNPTQAQIDAALGDLQTATIEINAEIDWGADHPAMTTEQLALCKGVCIDRAADLWRHRESAPGILGIVDEGVPTLPGRYSFARYVARLAVLKDQWGVA
jgi:hypothetical protein